MHWWAQVGIVSIFTKTALGADESMFKREFVTFGNLVPVRFRTYDPYRVKVMLYH